MPKKLQNFVHPLNDMTVPDAYLRIGPFSVDPNQLIASVRCDVYKDKATYLSAIDPETKTTDVRALVWSGGFTIEGDEFLLGYQKVQQGKQSLSDLFYEKAAQKLKVKFLDSTEELVLTGAVDVPD